MSEILKLIGVQPPYFALREIEFRDCSISAFVSRSHPLRSEAGPIAAAEAGRHLAIAGAVAVAHDSGGRGKNFYLARRAVLTKNESHCPTADAQDQFKVQASVENRTKRQANASAALISMSADGDNNLFRLSVEYDVVPAALFERLIRDLPVLSTTQSSFLDVMEQELEVLFPDDVSASTDLFVRSEFCEGHFPEYPSLPVAKTMHLLSNLAGELLKEKFGAELTRYSVERAEVEAENLAFAGNTLQLCARYEGREPNGTRIMFCEAKLGAKTCGSMKLHLSCQ